MNIVVFTSSAYSLPAINDLAQTGLLKAVVIPDGINEDIERVAYNCEALSIPTYKSNKETLTAVGKNALEKHEASVAFVMAFPFKIESDLLSVPSAGFYNFHFAPLPEYRGAEPMFWMVKNKETMGGISVHKMDDGWDTGPLAVMDRVAFDPEDTHGLCYIKTAFQNIQTVRKMIQVLESGSIPAIEQNESKAKYYKKPDLSDITIDWEKHDSSEVRALAKACNPWNKGAFTTVNQVPVKILEATIVEGVEDTEDQFKSGTIVTLGDHPGTFIKCCDKKILQLDIVSMEEGFLTGIQLQKMGIASPMQFGT